MDNEISRRGFLGLTAGAAVGLWLTEGGLLMPQKELAEAASVERFVVGPHALNGVAYRVPADMVLAHRHEIPEFIDDVLTDKLLPDFNTLIKAHKHENDCLLDPNSVALKASFWDPRGTAGSSDYGYLFVSGDFHKERYREHLMSATKKWRHAASASRPIAARSMQSYVELLAGGGSAKFQRVITS